MSEEKIYSHTVDGQIVETGIRWAPKSKTISFPKDCSDETYAAHGYLREIEQPDPVYNKNTHRLGEYSYTIVNNEVHKVRQTVALSQEEAQENFSASMSDADSEILSAYNDAYLRIVKNIAVIDEYKETERQAVEFEASGFSGQPPRMVAASMAYSGRGAQDEVVAIKQKAETQRDALATMREIRFTAKSALDSATTIEDIEAAKSAAIASFSVIG